MNTKQNPLTDLAKSYRRRASHKEEIRTSRNDYGRVWCGDRGRVVRSWVKITQG